MVSRVNIIYCIRYFFEKTNQCELPSAVIKAKELGGCFCELHMILQIAAVLLECLTQSEIEFFLMLMVVCEVYFYINFPKSCRIYFFNVWINFLSSCPIKIA